MTDVFISPEDVARAAGRFSTGQYGICVTWDELSATLSGCSGMAGHAPDRAALDFVSFYDKAVAAVWSGFGASVRSVGAISRCLGATAGNYLKADHSSVITVMGRSPVPSDLLFPSDVPYRDASHEVVTSKSVPDPPSALGKGGSSLPFDLGALWPSGHPDTLRTAASMWMAAHNQLTSVCTDLNAAIGTVVANCAEGEDILDVWSRVYSPGSDSSTLQGLVSLCGQLAHSCDAYANAIERAHKEIDAGLIGVGIVGGILSVAAIIATPVSGGASDAGAATADYALAVSVLAPIAAALVATVAGIVISAAIIDAVESAASHSPQPQPSDAHVNSLQGAFDRELGIMQGKQRSRDKPQTLSAGEQQALEDQAAGRPYDEKLYNSALRKIRYNEKMARSRNKQKRNK